jgi:hypothetical protein
MSELIEKLHIHMVENKGTELGGLLQWAALHIQSQDEALADIREEYANEERNCLMLERAAHDAKTAIEAALAAICLPLCNPVELGRDVVPHINLMAAHGDPDYLKKNGMSIRHIDLRKKKGAL